MIKGGGKPEKKINKDEWVEFKYNFIILHKYGVV